jgi:hypothetical protein
VLQGASVKHGLTMDIKMPDGSNYRIHVNGETGGNINMPRGAVSEPRIGPEPRLFEPAPGPGIFVVPQLVDPVEPPELGEPPVLDAGGGIINADPP